MKNFILCAVAFLSLSSHADNSNKNNDRKSNPKSPQSCTGELNSITNKSGVQYYTIVLNSIQCLLLAFPQEELKSYVDMLRSSEAKGLTYRGFMRDKEIAHEALGVQSRALANGFHGFYVISKLIKFLPVVETNLSERSEILAKLEKTIEQAAYLDSLVNSTLANFSSYNPEIIRTGLMPEYTETLSHNIEDVSALIESHIASQIEQDSNNP